MTERYRQAVMTYVNCSEKLSRTAEAAKRNGALWTIEKLKTADRICREIAKQREEAKDIITDEAKNEEMTREEYDWVMEKLTPYITPKAGSNGTDCK